MRDKFIIVLPKLYLKLRKYCNFGIKSSRRAWHVIQAQEVNHLYRLRTITSDQNRMQQFVAFLFNSSARYRWIEISLLFVLPILFYLNIVKTEKIQITILEQKVLDVRGTSFQHKRLTSTILNLQLYQVV